MMPKVHMRRVVRPGFEVAKCSLNRTEPKFMLTDNPAAVDCKQCLAAMKFDRECEEDWKRRREQEGSSR